MKIKILSWNIWRGKYLNKAVDLLQQNSPDIICLQEIVEKDVDNKRENLAGIIAKKLKYNFVYCRAFTTDRHEIVYDLGNAILSKHQILDSTCFELSGLKDYLKNSETEPRGAIKAIFQFGSRKINVITTHLAYSHELLPSKLRDKQVTKLLKIIEKENTVLTGDFNAEIKNPEIKKLKGKIINANNGKSMPTWSVSPTNYKGFEIRGLKYQIDHIFVSKDITIKQFKVIKTKASDHLPVMAVLEI
jgi:endonuclease/exonuclease/phosphatase family metal-dependent hydrolase